MHHSLTDLGAAALAYADAGRAVFPCLPNAKLPATRRGFRDASLNPATIRRWWQNTPYNIGIATGAPSQVFVLDVDGAEGAASLEELERKHGPLPETATSSTGDGQHRWFTINVPIQCSTGRVGVGLDVRGDGGYVIAPPSIHPNGKTYRWLVCEPLAPAPRWLLDLARKPKPKISEIALSGLPTRFTRHSDRYGQAALDYEIAELAKTPRGTRNHQLNRASFSLHQLVAGGELDGVLVRMRLVDACHANGLVRDDGLRSVLATINSGARAGLQSPRSRRSAA